MSAASPLMLAGNFTSDRASPREDVAIYVGGDNGTIRRERCDLTGRRCFSGAVPLKGKFLPHEAARIDGLMDSGAFSDPPERRLTFAAALDRQLDWERTASRRWCCPWRASAVVSYDLLIDEKWVGGTRRKERWSVAEADAAIRVTVDAAAYLSSERMRVAPRRPVLAAQGVDAVQYAECAAGVLAHCRPGDVFGLGGWCIVGLWKSWIPTFWGTARRVLPLVAAHGLSAVHIFGVMYRPVLGGLLWLCDRHGLALSTDSSGPLRRGRYDTPAAQKKAGALSADWRANVAAWRHALATLRDSPHYREPPAGRGWRQFTLW